MGEGFFGGLAERKSVFRGGRESRSGIVVRKNEAIFRRIFRQILHFTGLQELAGLLHFGLALCFAGGLKLLEQGEVLLQAAIDALLVEGQEFDAFGFAREGAGGGQRGVEFGMISVDFVGVVGEAEGEDVVFDGGWSD